GIKRGLAVSAVSALAVAGVPALASSASAAVGDTFTVVSAGPALNGGTDGALVTLRAKDGVITPGLIKAVGTSGTTLGTEDNDAQNVEVVSTAGPVNDTADSAYEFIQVRVAVTTTNPGDTAAFRLFEDDTNAGTLDASEARQPVSISTAGAAASLVVAPSSQSAPQGLESGEYTVTVKDAAGRTTQLASGQNIGLTSDAEVTVNESGGAITADEIASGSDTFTATPTGTAALGAHTITLNGPGSVDATATLNVTKSATLAASMVDIVTGADSWNGFGGGAFGGANTLVRVDQGTIKIDVKGGAGNANSTVSLNVAGTGITFGGKASTTAATVLDASGNGSLTITPDAGTVQVNDTIALSGSFAETLQFVRGTATAVVPTAGTYFSKVGGSTDATFKVVDQFGLPVTSGFVTAARDGANAAADATPQKKAVGADGTVTFTFTDTKATNGTTENVDVKYYADQFTPAGSPDVDAPNAAIIKYTTDGMGANYVTSLDGTNTEAAGYNASKVNVAPLADTVADDDSGSNEDAALTVTGGEPNAAMTISVDNGALILAPGQTALSEGKASVTATLSGAGALPAGYRIIGTKSGVVTATLSAANRTETAAFTVTAENDPTTARNVTVSGPAEVEHGASQITYTAVITDGFGNPVVGFPRSAVGTDLLNIQVSGPAQFKDGDAQSDATGAIKLNVAVDPGAAGDVTIQVKGVNNVFFLGGVDQFGAAKDRLTAQSTTDDGKGLPVSADTATATTTVADAPVEPPVEPVSPNMAVKGIDKGKRDVIKVNAIDAASGATVKLFKRKADGSLKKLKTAVLNDAGNFTFRVHDGNGTKATRYTVKLVGNDAVRPAVKSRKIK
ncbi:hypothetical protein, partial [Nocardioides sp.]|uniref:beta strand repeat-containing protein n=1 Tax=Nocardioides sp. TaxID=35761 RepID=UPI0025EBCA47